MRRLQDKVNEQENPRTQVEHRVGHGIGLQSTLIRLSMSGYVTRLMDDACFEWIARSSPHSS